jgi:hypothetical protein
MMREHTAVAWCSYILTWGTSTESKSDMASFSSLMRRANWCMVAMQQEIVSGHSSSLTASLSAGSNGEAEPTPSERNRTSPGSSVLMPSCRHEGGDC